jgi:hypothetical protein
MPTLTRINVSLVYGLLVIIDWFVLEAVGSSLITVKAGLILLRPLSFFNTVKKFIIFIFFYHVFFTSRKYTYKKAYSWKAIQTH